MAETLLHCPNCGYPVQTEGKLCPHCGAVLLPVWPPTPADQKNTSFPRLPENPGATVLGFVIGMGAEIVWWIFGAPIVYSLSYSRPIRPLILVADLSLFGPPAAGILIASFLLRPAKPNFARGLSYSVLTILMLMLGAIAVCH